MATITLKINERTKAGKAIKALIDVLANQNGFEIIETSGVATKEKSPYNPDFVAKIKQRETDLKTNKDATRLNPKDIWGSIL